MSGHGAQRKEEEEDLGQDPEGHLRLQENGQGLPYQALPPEEREGSVQGLVLRRA